MKMRVKAMKATRTLSIPLILAVSLITGETVQAGETWYTSVSASILPATYSDSDQRNSLLSTSLQLNTDYLDTVNISLFYNRTSIDFKKIAGVDNDIDQTAYAGRLQYQVFVDSLGGSIATGLTLHRLTNNDATRLSDEVSVVAPRISYLNYKKTLMLGVEYTQSDYPNNGNLKITQWVPSFGFSLNQGADWLSFRPFLIRSNDKSRSQNESSLSSITMQWMHWTAPAPFLGIKRVYADVMVGKRVYAVDNNSFSVYNLSDLQLGSASIGAGWKVNGIELNAILGTEKYENKVIDNRYSQEFLYLSATKQW